MATSARAVGFIGLGQMGFGMAANLLMLRYYLEA
jgi:3-hydroxyisobutyrate dehydrogenase-like beta-hydroxyacid dehydrogenase